MRIPMLDIPRLHRPFQQELEDAFCALSRSGQYINGPAVTSFEQQLTEYTGMQYSVATGSGTDALLCALMALDVGPGDEVITSAYTFFATAGCIARLGATPVFVDVDPATFNMDASTVNDAVTGRTVGIVPVHLFGRCADMRGINDIAARHGLFIIEDAAQSIGARHGSVPVGHIGAAAIFSFFPAKNLGALGDAGAIVTNEATLADQFRVLRSHGAATKYIHTCVGGNFRMDTLQAALLQIKLRYLTEWTEGRRRVAAGYDNRFRGHPDLRSPVAGADFHVYNQYVVRIRRGRRDAVQEALQAAHIGCAVYYPTPLHLQPCFADLGYQPGDLPVSEQLCHEALALPVDPNLTDADLDEVAATVISALS